MTGRNALPYSWGNGSVKRVCDYTQQHYTESDEEQQICRYALGFDGTWPALDGKPLCMSIADETESFILYNVPVAMYGQDMMMRVLVNYEEPAAEESFDQISDYIESTQVEITEDTAIEREKLPEGSYLVRFVIRDVFNNTQYSQPVTLNWDGETVYDYSS